MEKNYIDASAIESIIAANASGLTITVQKGFVKVTSSKGNSIYIAKMKRVARIDLSGFTLDHPCIMAHSAGKFGAVEQEIDFSRPEAEVLETIETVLVHMKTLPERKVVRSARQPKEGDAKGWSPEFLAAASLPDSSPDSLETV